MSQKNRNFLATFAVFSKFEGVLAKPTSDSARQNTYRQVGPIKSTDFFFFVSGVITADWQIPANGNVRETAK